MGPISRNTSGLHISLSRAGLVLLYGDFEILFEQHILVRFSEGERDRARARKQLDYRRGNQGLSRVQLGSGSPTFAV
jgi:hypothetical protein